MNVLIPMAGAGKRFYDAGYDKPKPLIDVAGQPMIKRVIDSLSSEKLDYLHDKGTIVVVDKMTEGAACTVLLAEDLIDNDDELVIANCDQYLQWSFYDYITYSKSFNGCLVTFNSTNPHHSYAKINKHRRVVEVAEKVVISDKASAGIYYFKHGKDFVSGAHSMIKRDIRTNNEFYICPVYNELLAAQWPMSIYEIDVNNKHMLGTPEELKIFLDKLENEEVSFE